MTDPVEKRSAYLPLPHGMWEEQQKINNAYSELAIAMMQSYAQYLNMPEEERVEHDRKRREEAEARRAKISQHAREMIDASRMVEIPEAVLDALLAAVAADQEGLGDEMDYAIIREWENSDE